MGEKNVDSWLDAAPDEVRRETARLMAEVESLRADQVIYPPQDAILRALDLTAPADVRCVILGQDPYHGPGQAMGLSFSVPEGVRLPPSLRNVYKEMAADLGCDVPASGDLTSWARQGVLLLNTTLTVVEHEANSHARLGWKVLTDYLVRRCLALPQPVAFLTWGRHAISLVAGAMEGMDPAPVDKLQLSSTHPSPLSATRGSAGLPAFMGSRPFSAVNSFLAEHGCEPIDWARAGGPHAC